MIHQVDELLVRSFLARAAAEYRHWIRHTSIDCVTTDSMRRDAALSCSPTQARYALEFVKEG
jgi:hypothetical protein